MNPRRRHPGVRPRGRPVAMWPELGRAARVAARSFIVAAAALALSPAAAHAQAPAYRRAPGDTLRYHEVTMSTVEMRAATGPVSVRTSHDARIALAFVAADTARAWVEALSLSVAGLPGQADRRPDTSALLRQPYTLVFGARGEVETVRTPELAAEIAQVSDLSAEFTDFFPRLPAGPLTPGATWADTASHETTNAAGRTVIAQRIGSYRVRGDSTIAGERVVVVELRTASEIATGTAAPRASGATMRSDLEGEETGTFCFAPATGRLVERRRTGRLTGAITVRGGGQQLSIPQTFTYESRIELIR